jgi:hypothetical protein
MSAIPGITFNNDSRSSLDSSIKILLFILGSISGERKRELEEDIHVLFSKNIKNDVIKNIIETKIEYTFQ